VKRALRHTTIVAGGGACEMAVSHYLHDFAQNDPSKQQAVIRAFAKALEVIPRQLCDNAGFDATDILNRLRVEHRKGSTWAGVDFDHEGVRDNMEAFVWEPSLVKVNAIQAAVEAACLILSVDETISMFPAFPFVYPSWGIFLLTHDATKQRTKNPPSLRHPPAVCHRVPPSVLSVAADGVCPEGEQGKREKHWRVKKELNIHDCDDEEKQVDTRCNTFPCRDQKSIFLYMILGTETQQKSATKRKSAIKSLELFSCNRFHPARRVNI